MHVHGVSESSQLVSCVGAPCPRHYPLFVLGYSRFYLQKFHINRPVSTTPTHTSPTLLDFPSSSFNPVPLQFPVLGMTYISRHSTCIVLYTSYEYKEVDLEYVVVRNKFLESNSTFKSSCSTVVSCVLRCCCPPGM